MFLSRPHCSRSLLLACFVLLASCGDGGDGESAHDPWLERVGAYRADGSVRDGVAQPKAARNLVIVVIDTLRFDAAALPGKAARGMPTLEALSSEGVSFSQAVAPCSWTIPSLASLLTGLLPLDHGCLDTSGSGRLADATIAFAEALSNGWGYETAVFSDGPWMRQAKGSIFTGFTRGSRGTDPTGARGVALDAGYSLHETRATLDAWLATRDARKPYFILLHTFQAHDPYGPENDSPRGTAANEAAQAAFEKAVAAFDVATAPTPAERVRTYLTDGVGRAALFNAYGQALMKELAEYMVHGDDGTGPDAKLVADVRAVYDRGVRHVDRGLEHCVAALRERSLLGEDTLLVVTSDHGEAFGEHRTLWHGQHLHDELVRIPLVMSGPPPFAGGRVVDEPVGLLDVLPTFFDWSGLPPLADRHGRSLLPLLAGEVRGRPQISEVRVAEDMAGVGVVQLHQSVRTREWKYILDRDEIGCTVRERLFDLRADPGEANDLVAAAGRWPELDLPNDFCAAIERVRDRLVEVPCALDWRSAGAGLAPGTGWTRPAPCGAN